MLPKLKLWRNKKKQVNLYLRKVFCRSRAFVSKKIIKQKEHLIKIENKKYLNWNPLINFLKLSRQPFPQYYTLY